MDNKKILTALGYTICKWDKGFPLCYTLRSPNGAETDTVDTELEAWNSVTLDANFCFREVVPYLKKHGAIIHVTDSPLVDKRSAPYYYVTFGWLAGYDNSTGHLYGEIKTESTVVETAILTAFERFLDTRKG